MTMTKIFPFLMLCAGSIRAQAQIVAVSEIPTATEIEQKDNDTAEVISTITVIQPRSLEQRMNAGLQSDETSVDNSDVVGSDGVASKVQGFRVQVFADNNQRTSQLEARKKERQINERFPEYETYIVYNSPYWRLKVGDFKSEFQAESAADEIKRAFPEFSREVRIVRDIVNIQRPNTNGNVE